MIFKVKNYENVPCTIFLFFLILSCRGSLVEGTSKSVDIWETADLRSKKALSLPWYSSCSHMAHGSGCSTLRKSFANDDQPKSPFSLILIALWMTTITLQEQVKPYAPDKNALPKVQVLHVTVCIRGIEVHNMMCCI